MRPRCLMMGPTQFDVADSLHTKAEPCTAQWLSIHTGRDRSQVYHALYSMRRRQLVDRILMRGTPTWVLTPLGRVAVQRALAGGRHPGVVGTGPHSYRPEGTGKRKGPAAYRQTEALVWMLRSRKEHTAPGFAAHAGIASRAAYQALASLLRKGLVDRERRGGVSVWTLTPEGRRRAREVLR